MNEKLKAFHQIRNHHLFSKLKINIARQRISNPVYLSKENNFTSQKSSQSFARVRNSYQSDKPIISISRPSLVFDHNPEHL
jgi:hypothetical protein